MRLRIGNFDVKVKARDIKAPHLKPNKDDTAQLLMELLEKLHDASHRERETNRKFTSDESRQWAFDISEALQNRGYRKKGG